jgi:hypothetical protein
MTKFPSSVYATKVKGKLEEVAGVKRVKDSIATAAAKRFTKDSLAAIQKTAQGDSTRIDTLSRKSHATGPVDSIKTVVKDTLQKRRGRQRLVDDDRELLKHRGVKRGQIDTLSRHPAAPVPIDSVGIPKGNGGQGDTSKTAPSDSLIKKVPQGIDEEMKIQKPERHPALPDTTQE